MPVYLFWGDEDFTLENEIKTIKDEVLDTSSGIEISPLNYRCLDNPDFKRSEEHTSELQSQR